MVPSFSSAFEFKALTLLTAISVNLYYNNGMVNNNDFVGTFTRNTTSLKPFSLYKDTL
jgi:hypothetical protein